MPRRFGIAPPYPAVTGFVRRRSLGPSCLRLVRTRAMAEHYVAEHYVIEKVREAQQDSNQTACMKPERFSVRAIRASASLRFRMTNERRGCDASSSQG